MEILAAIALVYLIVIGLWGLVAFGKLIQALAGIHRTLQEIKLVLQDGRNPSA